MQKSAEEGKALLKIRAQKRVSRKMPVFYNPVMKLNRDIAVLLLSSWEKNNLLVADVLAGTGIRSIRFLKELPEKKIQQVLVNDASPEAVKFIKKHIILNRVNKKKVKISEKDAGVCLLTNRAQDYIEVDPFGTPNPFLDSSVKKIRRSGILAVTATDTAALAGSSPNSCKRKYWAKPLKNECMHEIGTRILVRKVQLIGAQYEKALFPVFCHSTAHYIRVYFLCAQGRQDVRHILNHHGYFLYCSKCAGRAVSQIPAGKCCGMKMDYAGPLWLGNLFDSKLAGKMLKKSEGKAKKLLEAVAKEAESSIVCFYDIHKMCSILGISAVKNSELVQELKKRKFSVSETHFAEQGIRTDAPAGVLKKIILSLSD